MGSLKDSMDCAEKLGRQAAEKERLAAGGRGPWFMAGFRRDRSDGACLGALALSAFREHGSNGMKAVFRGYQAGYGGWSGGHALLLAAEAEAA